MCGVESRIVCGCSAQSDHNPDENLHYLVPHGNGKEDNRRWRTEDGGMPSSNFRARLTLATSILSNRNISFWVSHERMDSHSPAPDEMKAGANYHHYRLQDYRPVPNNEEEPDRRVD